MTQGAQIRLKKHSAWWIRSSASPKRGLAEPICRSAVLPTPQKVLPAALAPCDSLCPSDEAATPPLWLDGSALVLEVCTTPHLKSQSNEVPVRVLRVKICRYLCAKQAHKYVLGFYTSSIADLYVQVKALAVIRIGVNKGIVLSPVA